MNFPKSSTSSIFTFELVFLIQMVIHVLQESTVTVLGNTWDGIMSLPDQADRGWKPNQRARRQRPSVLPPLASIPPPVALTSLTSLDINLFVDFEREIKPYLTDCLVLCSSHRHFCPPRPVESFCNSYELHCDGKEA